MHRQKSFHILQEKQQKQITRSKLDITSFHYRSLNKSIKHHHESSTNLLGKKNLPIITTKNKMIPLYLFYQNQKILIQVNHGMPFKQLINLLYKQILRFQETSNNKNNEEIEKILKSILGFSTVHQDLNTDYLLSIQQGKVQKSLLLQCFMRKNEANKRKIKKITQNQISSPNSRNRLSESQTKITKSTINDKFQYEIYNCLAIGGFSKVFLVRSYENGKFYVIKFIKKRMDQDYQINRQSVKNQMKISSKLNHPFITQLIEGFETPKFFGMVFQYCPGGQLFYLLKRVRIMSQQNARFYVIQILLGIKHIHQKNIIYRDLKPQNILIDEKGNLKIVDFGLSKQLINSRQKTFSYCGSAQYMAPQMILRSGHNILLDYYSLGALLYQLVIGLPPFYTKNQKDLQQSIINQQLSFPKQIHLSMEIKDFLRHLLEKDQRYRLGSYAGIKQIMLHPWIGKFKQKQFLEKNSNIFVPYPPNLQQHNFDMSQLGDDYQQFTKQVLQQFYYNNKYGNGYGSKNIQFHVKAEKSDQNHIYYDIIKNILDEKKKLMMEKNNKIQQQDQNNKQNIKQKQRSIKGLKNRRKEFYKFDNSLEKEHKSNITSMHASSYFLSRRSSPLVILKSVRNEEIQNNESLLKSKQKLQKKIKAYQKLFPYFTKNKALKPESILKQEKKHLPKANILKLKVITNSLKEQIKI